MFGCHLNVDLWAFRVGEIKYLFGYAFKVENRVAVQLARGWQRKNEIIQFQNPCYISTSKALRRAF